MIAEDEEGTRSFLVMVNQIQQGAVANELARKAHRLQKRLSEFAQDNGKAVGELTFKVKFTHTPDGIVSVATDITTKEPRRKRAGVFFLTRGKNLSVDNPNNKQMPLIDVSAAAPAREVPEEPRQAPRVVDG
jgi:hypothetical protein